MTEVNVTELRQHLPAYLARVAKGERVRVTSRGRVIAELAPPRPEESAIAVARQRLLGSVIRFDDPTEPVLGEWEMER